MAAFGDSNDIKINVTLDTEDAVKAAQDLKTAIENSLKATETQFQKLQQLSKSLSSTLAEQSKAAGQVQVTNTKQVLDQTVAANAAAADKAVKITEEGAAKRVKAEQRAQAQILEAQKVAVRAAEAENKRLEIAQKETHAKTLERIAELNLKRTIARKTPRAELPEDLGGVGSSGKLLKELEGIAVSVGNRFGFLTVSVEKSYKILSLLGQTTAGTVSAGMLGLKLAADKASVAVDQLAQQAGKLEGLKTGFETLQRSIGQSPIASIEALRKATQGLISDTELYQRANQAVLLGVPTNIFNESAAAAVKLGRAMGIDAAFGLESLSLGLGRQSRLYLDNLGIVVSAEEAYRNFGATVGKSAADLDDAEKKAAFFAEALKKIKERADELPDPLDTVATAQTKANVAQENANRLYLEAFNNTSNLTEQYKAQQAIVEVNSKNAQIYGAALGELGAVAKGISNGFAAAGAVISTGFASALDYVFNLSPEKKIAVLSDEIKETSAQLEVLKTRAKEGFVLDIFAKANAREIEELTKKLEEDNKKLETFKNLVGQLDGKNIKVNIDLSGIETAQDNISNLFSSLRREAEGQAGIFKVAGLSDQAAAGFFAQFKSAKEEFDKSLNKTEALEKYNAKLQQLQSQISGAPIKEAATGLASAASGLISAVGVGDIDKIKSGFASVGSAIKGVAQSANASKVSLKDLERGFSGVSKKSTETTRKLKEQEKQVLRGLKKQLKAFDDFADGIDRIAGTAVPEEYKDQIVALFLDSTLSADKFAEELKKVGKKAQDAGIDLNELKDGISNVDKAFKKTSDAKVLKNAFGGQPAEDRLQELKKQSFDLKKLLDSVNLEFGSEGAFFGFDISSAFGEEQEAALASQIQSSLVTGLSGAFDSTVRKDYEQAAKDVGATIGAIAGAVIGEVIVDVFTLGLAPGVGAAIGAAIGSVIGSAVGDAVYRLGGDGPGTKERKAIDSYFAKLFEGGRLAVVLQGQLTGAIDEATGEAIRNTKPQLVSISDLIFEGATPFGGQVPFGGEGFTQYFETLSSDIQASFNGVGIALGSLLGVSSENARRIGIALANNIGGSLQNLQVLIQATGESFDDMAQAVLKSFLDAQLSIEEAYNALVQLQNLYGVGIPGAVGAYQEAIDNLNASLQSNAPGRYAIDSLRDIGAEGAEAKKTFESVISSLAQTFNFTADQQVRLFEALRINGITSLAQLQSASDEQLLAILRNIELIRQNATAPLVTTPTTTIEKPKTPSGGGGGVKREDPRVAAEKKLREEVRNLTRESQAYLDILAKITSGELARGAAGAEIIKLQSEIEKAVRRRNDLEKKLNDELDKGSKANKKRLADLASQLDAVNEKIDGFKKKAETTTRVFKELDIKGVIPFIKDANNLGVIAEQVGVSFKKASDILVKGFLQGRLSLAELRAELDKTKETLGPGIPNAVGAVTDAFQNLIDAGTQGGQFSVDAFTDIFAEFREKFQKEGSALREAERKQLNQNLAAAREAFANAVGPEATAAAKKTLDEAKKALDDFYAAVPAPDLADLRNQLQAAFGRENVDKFFQALDESGLKTFEDFEKAGTDSVVGILTKLQELGFNFGQTSQDIIDAQTKLQEAEKEANAGLDPMQEAINLIKGLNEGAAQLPPVFNATTQAIEGLNGPLGSLASGFDDIIEKLAKLKGPFETDVVFNISTTGDSTGKALVDILFGNGEGTTQDVPSTTSGNPPAGDSAPTSKKDKWVRVGPGLYKNVRTGKTVKSKTNPGRR